MSKAPSMPLFCDAYLADTRHLSTEEHGAYLLILMSIWRNNGYPLVDDDVRMARIAGVSEKRWIDKIRPAIAPFFDLAGGTWRQGRLEKEWNFIANRLQQKRDAAKKSHGPNSLRNNNNTPADAGISQAHQQLQPTPIPISKKEEPPFSPPSDTDPSPLAPENLEPKLDLGLNADLGQPGVAEKTKKSTTDRGSRLPKDWALPDDWADWAITEGLGIGVVVAQGSKFKDYWISKAGKDGRKADWKATWRNWIRNSIERQNNGIGNKPKDSFLELAKRELGLGLGG